MKARTETATTSERGHSELEYQELLIQVQLLQTKLNNKVDVLLEVSKNLATCQSQKDEFQTQSDVFAVRLADAENTIEQRHKGYEASNRASKMQHAELIAINESVTRDRQRVMVENETLRQALDDSHGDIKVMRDRLATLQLKDSGNADLIHRPSTASSFDQNEVFTLATTSTTENSNNTAARSLQQVEQMNQRVELIPKSHFLILQYTQLECDLRSLLCEKEELIDEKQTYKAKCERLTRELTLIINNDTSKIATDVDGIIAENRYLSAQIEHAHEETGLARAALNRYRSLLERKKKPDGPGATLRAAKDNGTVTSSSEIMVVSPKQVRDLLGGALAGLPDMPVDGQPVTDYRALCTALYDAVTDKNLALSHQKKANKILGARLSELDVKVRTFESNIQQQRSPSIRRQSIEVGIPLTIECQEEHSGFTVPSPVDTECQTDTTLQQTRADECQTDSLSPPDFTNVGIVSSTHYESNIYPPVDMWTDTQDLIILHTADSQTTAVEFKDSNVQTELSGVPEHDSGDLPVYEGDGVSDDDDDDFMSAVTSDLTEDQELEDKQMSDSDIEEDRSATPTLKM